MACAQASSDAEAMAKATKTFDGIIDTVAADHDVNQLIKTLDIDGVPNLISRSTGKPVVVVHLPAPLPNKAVVHVHCCLGALQPLQCNNASQVIVRTTSMSFLKAVAFSP